MEKPIILLLISIMIAFPVAAQCNTNSICEWPETCNTCDDCHSCDVDSYPGQRAKYIDQSCQNNGNGLSDNCATSAGGSGRFNELQNAIDSLIAGDTLYIHPGDYWRDPENWAIYQFSADGTQTQPIIITAADPNDPPVLHSADPTGQNDYFSMALGGDGHYTIIDNLIIDGGVRIGGGDWGNGLGKHITLQNLECTGGWGPCDGNWACLRAEWCEDCTIHHNFVHDVEDNGRCDGTHDPRETGLKEFTSNRTIWEYNTVRDTVRWGYDLHRHSFDPTIRYNVFENAGNGAVIRVNRAADRHIYGNTVVGGGACITTMIANELYNGNPEDEVYHNTCAHIYRAIDVTHDIPATVMDNIIFSVDTNRVEGGNVNTPGNIHTVDYNAYDSDGYYHDALYDYGTYYASLQEWQTAMGYDMNSNEGPGSYCTFIDAPTSATDYNYDLHITGACTTASSTGGEIGAYGITDCVGHTCGRNMVIQPYCGDTECNGDDDCDNCPEDCVDCPPTQSHMTDECDSWNNDWIFCDDFESTGPFVAQGRYFEYADDDGEFDAYESVGLEGSRGMEVTFQEGEVEAGALHLAFGRVQSSYMDKGIRSDEDFQEIYYRFYMRNDPEWEGDPAKVSRATVFYNGFSQAMIAHFWSDGEYRLLMDPVSCVSGSTPVCHGYNDFNNMDWLGWGPGTTPIFNGDYNDQWLCIEHHVRLNDPGQSNGIQEFWIDGNLEARHDDMNFVGSYTDYKLNAVYIESYWNSGSIKEQNRYYDNFIVSTQPIGCGDVCQGVHTADNNPCDGTLSPSEFMNFVMTWISGSATMQDILEAIIIWKGQS